MKCLIAGAGPGGLIAAIALKRQGFGVRILERVPQFRSLGGGLALQSNGLRLFQHLGLLDPLRPQLRLFQTASMELWGHRTLSAFDFRKLDIPFPYFGVVLRFELHEFLLAQLAKEGLRVEMGREVIAAKSLSHESTPTVEIEIRNQDGTTTRETTQVLIGAEGVHSPVRKSLVAAGRLQCREIRHEEAWLRMVVPLPGQRDGPVEIWGNDGRRVGIVPLPDGLAPDGTAIPRTYCFMSVGKSPWAQVLAGEIDSWKASWASYGKEVMAILDAVENWQEVNHSAFHEIECNRWSDPPIFLVGDAVHGMTPNLGQGANCAMVDGLILAQLLGQYPDRLGLVAENYHRLRFSFVSRIQKTARMMGHMGAWKIAPLRWLRNGAIRLSDGFPSLTQSQGRLIAGYNPLEKNLF